LFYLANGEAARDSRPVQPRFDDLTALLCFARVVERRSFTQAAVALGVSKSAVSERVAALEERLGERLLIRTTRKLEVTEAGLEVYAHAARMVDSAGAATRTAGAGRGMVRVNAPVTFAAMYLAAPIASFMADHPDVAVDLVLDDRLIDLVEQRTDLAIRISKLRESSLVARRLATTELHVVGAPAYLRQRGTPARPEDLLRHECLRYAVLRPEQEWRLYGPNGRIQVPVVGRFTTSTGASLRAAALAGLGLAVLPRFMIHDELRSGALIAVLGEFAPRPLGIYAIQPARRAQPPRIRALVDHLARALRRPPWAAA
jgi:DNA-binding transcriptional LysR family regulator